MSGVWPVSTTFCCRHQRKPWTLTLPHKKEILSSSAGRTVASMVPVGLGIATWSGGLRPARSHEQRILRRAADMQFQLAGSAEAVEQRGGQTRVAVGPAEAVVRLEADGTRRAATASAASISAERARRAAARCAAPPRRASADRAPGRAPPAPPARETMRTSRRPRRQLEHVHAVRRRRSHPAARHRPADAGRVDRSVGSRGARTRAIQQPPPDRIHDRPAGQHRRTGRLRRQVPAALAILEQPAIAVVAVALGRRAVRQQHVVRRKFDVVDASLPARGRPIGSSGG